MSYTARNRCYAGGRAASDSRGCGCLLPQHQAAPAWETSRQAQASSRLRKGYGATMRQTNVKDIRFGRGIVDGVAKGVGRFAVSTMDVPWGLVNNCLGASPAHVIMVRDMAHDYVERMERETPPVDTMATLSGGGQAMDMGKYIADKRGLRLINIPTIVSTNAYVTSTAGLREPDASVRYFGNISPDLVVVRTRSHLHCAANAQSSRRRRYPFFPHRLV